jgi:uncharacterized protein
MKPDVLSVPQARRAALAAQGFGRPRPSGPVGRRHLRGVIERLGLLQIDSVNVLQRAHYIPAFSRLGPYPCELLDAMAWDDHELFEYWGHEASLMPVRFWQLMRWRMTYMSAALDWGTARRLASERPELIQGILDDVKARGPLRARELAGAVPRSGTWWSWSESKTAVEYLFDCGLVTATRVNFERHYAVPEALLPLRAIQAPQISAEDARRELLRIAARALGVATQSDIFDYFRFRGPSPQPQFAELVEAGELIPVQVAGWPKPAFRWHETRIPRQVIARALISPFDSLIFERSRAERLFGIRYRLEIYVPAAKRRHGYYVLPFLLGDTLVARVDLKADRKAGSLLVQAAYAEPGAPEHTPDELARELGLMARWLGLRSVEVRPKGDLAGALAARVREVS